MPVSPLSDVMLCLLMWLFRWLGGTAVACHNDSLPGNHADEQSEPAGKLLRAPLGLSRPPASGARKRPHIAGERASLELGAGGRLGFWAET